MADKAISELIAASQVTPTDLFVLEQSGTAKKLTGQTLENWLLSFADGHGGIQSIEKVGTSDLVDTYRITLADTTTVDFTVTNGRAISSVAQTAVSNLTRTYTIAFNDGTSESFTVTDGRSITNIAKTGTNVLTDTYTISYNDGSTSTFTVKNGRGIQSFAKVSTSGLVDTYRITYNDGTVDEFAVTNGAKGDKGDNTYTWIKYASQEPTESSHSFGDIPDNWIGIYSGSSSTAPTDWTEYSWFKIKGEKGDTGAAAMVVSNVVDYKTSDSGTIIPSGNWQTSVPVVAQGRYLWTRTTTTYNSGSPSVAYAVSRMGIDGTGSVSSVANISPDANGNVPLTAEHVGALPNTGGDMSGEIRMNGQPVRGLNAPTANDQAANMGFVNQQVKKAAPRNLLDNSDFRNPVNQRGQTSYTGFSYTIDRWKVNSSTTLTLMDGFIRVGGQYNFWQTIATTLKAGKTYTCAAKMKASSNTRGLYFYAETADGVRIGAVPFGQDTLDTEWRIYLFTIAVGSDAAGAGVHINQSNLNTEIGTDVAWVALYEGEYTAETLPEYQPKGYGAELAECLRYFERLGGDSSNCLGNAVYCGSGSGVFIASIQFYPKRIPHPTVTVYAPSNYRILVRSATDGGVLSASSVLSFGVIDSESPFAMITVNLDAVQTQNFWAVLQRQDGAVAPYIDVSADL